MVGRVASFVVGGEPSSLSVPLPLLEANSNHVFQLGTGNVIIIHPQLVFSARLVSPSTAPASLATPASTRAGYAVTRTAPALLFLSIIIVAINCTFVSTLIDTKNCFFIVE